MSVLGFACFSGIAIALQAFYYHGMGPEGKWAGWAPFSDWFRYEVLLRPHASMEHE